MGKNRKSGSNSLSQNPEFLKNLAEKIATWEEFGKNDPTHKMTEEEMNYIKEHEEIWEYVDNIGRPINSLYRVERPYHLAGTYDGSIDAIMENVHKGDILGDIDKDPASYRSFSDDAKANYTYLSSNATWSQAVILRTHGNISMFDPRNLANIFPTEHEVWVGRNNLKVDNLTRFQGDEVSRELQKELGITSMYDIIPNDVLVIDVSPVGDDSYSRRGEMWQQLRDKYPQVYEKHPELFQ